MYNCKFVDGFGVMDFELLEKPSNQRSDITLKEEGPVAIITKPNRDGTLVPEIFVREKSFKTDIYTNKSIMVLLDTETLKLTETFTALPSMGFQLVSYSEYQCEVAQQF